MKAERRHELKENDLAHALGVAVKYLEKNGTSIGVVVVIVVAAVAAVAYAFRSRSTALEDVWERRGQLVFDEGPEVGRESLQSMATMIQSVSDESFVLSSLVEQGQQALRLAQEVPVPPDRDLNETAEEAFEQLLGRFGDNTLAVGIAHIGLATVEENKFVLDGDLVHKERADGHLAAIIDNLAMSGMPFVRMAMDRRKSLDDVFTEVVFEQPVPEEPQEEAAGDEVVAGEAAEPVDEPAPVDFPEEIDNVSVDDEPEAVSPLEEVTEELLPAAEDSGTDTPQKEADPGEPAEKPEATETGDPD